MPAGMVLSRGLAVRALLALTLAGAAAAAQSLSSVHGFVSDDTGAALAGVTVELVDRERGHRRTVVSNDRGFFALRAVLSGEYDLIASLPGFRTVRRTTSISTSARAWNSTCGSASRRSRKR